MKLAVPREIKPGENRVALIPDTVTKMSKMSVTVHVEAGAGTSAGFVDSAYEAAGAVIVKDGTVYKDTISLG